MDLGEARRVARRRQRPGRTSDDDKFALGGGLNLVDPPLVIKPGYALAGDNYEIGINGGYERTGGFERFDGHSAPSGQTYYVIGFRHAMPFTVDLVAGELVTGLAAGSAHVIEAVELEPWGRCYCAAADDLSDAEWTINQMSVVFAPEIDPPERLHYGVDLNGTTADSTLADSRDTSPSRVWRLVENSVSGSRFIRNKWINDGTGLAIGDRLRASVFVKKESNRYVRLSSSYVGFAGGVQPVAVFDLENLEVVSSSSSVAEASFEDRDYGNDWLRITFVTNAVTNATAFNFYCNIELVDDSLNYTYVGDGVSGVLVTGLNTDKRAGAAPHLAPFVRSRAAAELPLPAGVAYVAMYALTTPFTNTVDTQGSLRDSSAVTVGTWSGGEQERAASSVTKHREYLSYVADLARANIAKLPGDGQVRGVWLYAGLVLGFRDDTSGTPDVCKMYKSTAGGWSEVTFAPHLEFDAGLAAGATAVVEGATITGGTSAATAVIKRIGLTSSNWAGNVAVGTLVLGPITGGPFQNNEAIKIGGVTQATANGDSYVPTWTNGGRYRFRNNNFYGASNKKRMYGVNGLNRFFEYDSSDGILASYATGMATDAPKHIATHQEQLYLSFLGGSVQRSGVGAPSTWTVVLGAAEIAVGDEITGFLEEVGESLFIFCRSRTLRLIGNLADGHQLDKFDSDNGALENSVQRIGFGIHLDDRGFTSLMTAQEYGNYQAKTFSRLIQPLVDRLLKSATVTESVIHSSGNRYRCFFNDGTFISIGTAGNKITGHMVCSYAGKVVRCAVSGEDTSGIERVFFGSDDGYVYEAQKGTSFDGAVVTASLRPAYHHSGRPDRIKTYRSGRIEAVLQGGATLFVTADLSFGKQVLAERDVSAALGGAIWNYQNDWETFQYNAPIEPLKSFKVGADGTNIGLLMRHVSKYELPHTLRAVVFQTSMRALARGASVG